MDFAIATVCLSGTLDEKLQAIARAEFKAVEIFENDLLSYNGTPTEVRRMAEDLGLRIGVYQPFRDSKACRSRGAPRCSAGPSGSSTRWRSSAANS